MLTNFQKLFLSSVHYTREIFHRHLMGISHVRSNDLLHFYDAASSSLLSQVLADISWSASASSSAYLNKFMCAVADTGRWLVSSFCIYDAASTNSKLRFDSLPRKELKVACDEHKVVFQFTFSEFRLTLESDSASSNKLKAPCDKHKVAFQIT